MDTVTIIKNMYKRWKIYYWITFILTIVLGILYIKYADKKYTSKMLIELNDSQQNSFISSGLIDINSLIGGNNINTIATEKIRLTSEPVIEKIVDELNLVDYYNKNLNIIRKLLKTKIEKRNAINILKKQIVLEEVPSTNYIYVSFTSTDPTLSASVVQRIYDYYIEYTVNKQKEFFNSYKQKLENIKKTLEEELNKKTQEIIDFELKNKVFSSSLPKNLIDKYYEIYNNLFEIENQRYELRNKIELFENNYVNIDDSLKKELVISSNPDITSLKRSLLNEKLELETLKSSNPNSPKIYEMETHIKLLEQELDKEVEKILSNQYLYLDTVSKNDFKDYISLKSQYEKLDVYKSFLEKTLKDIDAKIYSQSPLYYEYFNLKKEQEIASKKLSDITSLIDQINLKDFSIMPKFDIIEKPYPPKSPSSPNKNLLLATTIFLAIIMGFLGIYLKEHFNNKIIDIDLFKQHFKEPDIYDDIKFNNIRKYLYNNHIKKAVVYPLNLKEFDYLFDEYEIYEIRKNTSFKDIKEINEKIKKLENVLIIIDSSEKTDIELFKEIKNRFVLIEEKYTYIDDVERIKELQNNVKYIYIKTE
ncbi:GumC family protein [Marinitoga aeolica]|uniref:Polysaccharide chain length determinant N-terminal domain-containing protein n=1 Tax=Marinitoga aeolica TaxID=2809031 RepID=A0ABY8PTP6_9BACT|nr:hypothetical protein [Marinitoga aeolica]WGS66026.1 hypothetical protein JRV97_05615 [Marinitoga aeolica]